MPIDAAGGLFDRRRQALMRGDHGRRREPELGHIYTATIDIGGQDEAATDPVAQLANPGRDYTVVTVFDVIPDQLPVYRAVDVLVDHGSRHFERDVYKRQGQAHLHRHDARWVALPPAAGARRSLLRLPHGPQP